MTIPLSFPNPNGMTPIIPPTATFELEFADAAGKAILTSERSGWNHLYLLDLQTTDLTPITSGCGFVVGDAGSRS